jgi:hypothetical protein
MNAKWRLKEDQEIAMLEAFLLNGGALKHVNYDVDALIGLIWTQITKNSENKNSQFVSKFRTPLSRHVKVLLKECADLTSRPIDNFAIPRTLNKQVVVQYVNLLAQRYEILLKLISLYNTLYNYSMDYSNIDRATGAKLKVLLNEYMANRTQLGQCRTAVPGANSATYAQCFKNMTSEPCHREEAKEIRAPVEAIIIGRRGKLRQTTPEEKARDRAALVQDGFPEEVVLGVQDMVPGADHNVQYTTAIRILRKKVNPSVEQGWGLNTWTNISPYNDEYRDLWTLSVRDRAHILEVFNRILNDENVSDAEVRGILSTLGAQIGKTKAMITEINKKWWVSFRGNSLRERGRAYVYSIRFLDMLLLMYKKFFNIFEKYLNQTLDAQKLEKDLVTVQTYNARLKECAENHADACLAPLVSKLPGQDDLDIEYLSFV